MSPAYDPTDPRERDRARAVAASFGALRGQLVTILYAADPLALAADGAPPDEYVPEADTTLPRLAEARSGADVARILHEEFSDWFTAELAGPPERYRAAGELVWEAWQRWLEGQPVRD